MKKGLALIALVVIVVSVYFVFFNKEDKKEAPKDQPLTLSKNSAAFNTSFNNMLNSYYALKEALVEWDTAKASQNANSLATVTEKIDFKELKGDSTLVLTAKSFADGIIADCKGIAGDSSIDEKRKSFYTLSENIYTLINTVHYDQQVIYHMKCPMALGDDKAAYWIANNSEIINPYLGKKHPKYHSAMVTCGSVEDSIDYRPK